MNDEHWGFWRSVLSETAGQILKHYGMSLCDPTRWTPLLTDGDHVVGSVYFGGAQVRGGLTLCAPKSFLDTANPVGIPIVLADFARELTNQILGGVKSRVANYRDRFLVHVRGPRTSRGTFKRRHPHAGASIQGWTSGPDVRGIVEHRGQPRGVQPFVRAALSRQSHNFLTRKSIAKERSWSSTTRKRFVPT